MKMLIRGGVHSGWSPFGIVSIRDDVHSGCVHSGLRPFGMVSIQDRTIRDCVHWEWSPFDSMSIRDGVHSGWCPCGMVSIRDGAHSGLCPFGNVIHSGMCPFGNVSIPLGMVSIRDCVFLDCVFWNRAIRAIVRIPLASAKPQKRSFNCFEEEHLYKGYKSKRRC